MEHTLLVAVHAGSAVLALVAACALLAGRSPERLCLLLVVTTATTTAALAALVAVDRPGLPPAQRITFTALDALAVVLVLRAALALAEARLRRPGWRLRLLRHAGFVVVSLLDAFCVLSAVDLRLPPVAVAVVAVLATVPGVVLVRRAVRRERSAVLAA